MTEMHLRAPDGSIVVCTRGFGPVIPERLDGESETDFWSRLHGSALEIRVAASHDKDRLVTTVRLP